jgi:hypothetical protein
MFRDSLVDALSFSLPRDAQNLEHLHAEEWMSKALP